MPLKWENETRICVQCSKEFDLRPLDNSDDDHDTYELRYCPPCRLEVLAGEGIEKFAFMMGAIVIGYSLEDISQEPELRYIELKLTNGKLIKIGVRDTRWAYTPYYSLRYT